MSIVESRRAAPPDRPQVPPGDYPARVRLIVTDTSGNTQLGALWGLQGKHYDAAASAALVYEAEALTPLNGAVVVTGVAGASGGKVVQHSTLPAGSWVSVLSTSMAPTGTTPLTHTGSYHVWTRVQAVSGTPPQLQFLWGVGSLSAPVTNNATTVPNTGGFYLMDLGEIRLDPPPTGTNQWFGVIQAQVAVANSPVQIDVLYLQPVDDGAGELIYTSVPPASSIALGPNAAGAGADNAGVGTTAWSNPGNITVQDSVYANAIVNTGMSHYLVASSFGFNLPSTATINGIVATMVRGSNGVNVIQDAYVQLVKAGSIQTTNRANGVFWWAVGQGKSLTYPYGSSSDLWGTTWTYADINNSGFGVALAVQGNTFAAEAHVDFMSITVYYTLASGFSVAQDAVVYANQSSEFRYDGMYRTPGNNVYGPISQKIGDLPRLPSSGIEQRTIRLFVKPSRGDLGVLPDGGLDSFTVQPRYRPCWLSRP